MDATTLLLATATVTGLYMAWNIGANDVANAMGTSVGSGALTLRAAIVVAAIFEFSGAMLVGGTVTQTISKGIISLDAIGADALLLATGMTCALLSAAIWLHVATYFGWPVSTTHSIVGAVVGFGLVAGGLHAVQWLMLLKIAASWVISPAMGALVGFACFVLVRRLVLGAASPLTAMRRVGPVLVFPVFALLTLALLFKGLKPLHLDLPMSFAAPLAAGVGLTASLLAVPLLGLVAKRAMRVQGQDELKQVERVFLALQILTACFVAFAHGSNDVANAVGPLAAVYASARGTVSTEVTIPVNVLTVGAVGIVFGLATYGYRVMGTIGRDITELTPSRGFVAEFAAASTIVLASKLGLPVSTTHTLVGAVIGVGFARSIGAINMGVLRGIIASWFITVPFTAVLSAVLVFIARLLLG
ncbi:MAG: inorganic phosphate transporter [Polyangiales bacterium]